MNVESGYCPFFVIVMLLFSLFNLKEHGTRILLFTAQNAFETFCNTKYGVGLSVISFKWRFETSQISWRDSPHVIWVKHRKFLPCDHLRWKRFCLQKLSHQQQPLKLNNESLRALTVSKTTAKNANRTCNTTARVSKKWPRVKFKYRAIWKMAAHRWTFEFYTFFLILKVNMVQTRAPLSNERNI